MSDLRAQIEKTLLSHRLQHQEIVDAPGDGYPLLDALSVREDISTGREEIELLADAIAGDLEGAPPSALPEPELQPTHEGRVHCTGPLALPEPELGTGGAPASPHGDGGEDSPIPCPSAEQVFAPNWPEGLEAGKFHRVPCDDKGAGGGCWLQVMVAPHDGDVYVSMQDWERMPEGKPNPLPSLRSRTAFGGGRNHRTHQALLWLARAIQLDAEEAKACGGWS